MTFPFYYDGTSNLTVGGRIGIGTITPSEALDVIGTIRSTSQIVSAVATGTAPFVVSSTTVVTNLNADLLDGQTGSYYQDPTNLSSAVPVNKGGTGQTTLAANKVIVGNDTTGVLTPTNLHWDNTNSRLGIGTTDPQARLHIIDDNTTGIKNPPPLLFLQNPIGNRYSSIFKILDKDNNDPNGTADAGFSIDTSSGTGQINLLAGADTNNGVHSYTSTRGASRIQMSDAAMIFYTSTLGSGGGQTKGSNVSWNTSISIVSSNVSMAGDLSISGNTGIGTTTPLQRLHVVGNIFSTGDVTASSDSNLKADIRPITSALDKVCSLTGLTFVRRDDPAQRRAVGLIAQEVEKVLPEAVYANNDGAGLSVAYGNMVGLLVQAIKELRDEHQRDIASLRAELEEIRRNG